MAQTTREFVRAGRAHPRDGVAGHAVQLHLVLTRLVLAVPDVRALPVALSTSHAFYGSRSLRGTEVAVAFYTLCETARLVGVDPRAYLLRAVYSAIGRPGTVTFPEDLLASTLTG